MYLRSALITEMEDVVIQIDIFKYMLRYALRDKDSSPHGIGRHVAMTAVPNKWQPSDLERREFAIDIKQYL